MKAPDDGGGSAAMTQAEERLRAEVRHWRDRFAVQQVRIVGLEDALRVARVAIVQAQADYDDVEDQANLQAEIDRIDLNLGDQARRDALSIGLAG